MRWRIALAVLAVGASGAGAASSAGSDPCRVAWWPQPRQSSCASSSADNTKAPSPTTAPSAALAWTYDSHGFVSAPVVDNGVVYVQTLDAERRPRLRALELASGKQIWEAFGGSGGSPPVVDGDVLLRVTDGWLLKRYGLRRGQIAWSRTVAAPATEGWTGIPVVADHNWYLPTGETLLAYGERVGRPRWSQTLDCTTCGIAAAGGRVYAGGGSAISAFDSRHGATVWSTRLEPKQQPRAVALAGGRVFVVTEGRAGKKTVFFIEAFAAADGRRLWRTPVGSEDGSPTETAVAATALLVVYASMDGYVYALDAQTGAVRWRHLFSPTNSVAALVNGLAWLVDDKNASLVALALSDGRQVWSAPLGESLQGKVDPSAVVAGDTVLLPMPSGRLLAYRVRP